MAETLEIVLRDGPGGPPPAAPPPAGWQGPAPAAMAAAGGALAQPGPAPPPVVQPFGPPPLWQPGAGAAPAGAPAAPGVPARPSLAAEADRLARQQMAREQAARDAEERQRRVQDRIEELDPARRRARLAREAEEARREQLAGLQRLGMASNLPLLAQGAAFQQSFAAVQSARTRSEAMAGAAGMAGSVFGAAQELQALGDRIAEGMRQGVEHVGQQMARIARADTKLLGDNLQKTVEKIGGWIAGPMAGEMVKQWREANEGAVQTARGYAPYSAMISLAEAQADVAKILGDIRRAQANEAGLAKLIEQNSRFDELARDIMAKFAARQAEGQAAMMEFLADQLEKVARLIGVEVRKPGEAENPFLSAIESLGEDEFFRGRDERPWQPGLRERRNPLG